jgi:hypothetical protein
MKSRVLFVAQQTILCKRAAKQAAEKLLEKKRKGTGLAVPKKHPQGDGFTDR